MTTGHLITDRNLTLLCNVNADGLVHTRRQLITGLACKYLGIHNNSVRSMRNLQRCITNLTRLLTENCAKQSLLSSKLCLSLRSNFTYQNITSTNFCTDADDTSLIQILQRIVTDTRNISCDLFRSQFGVTRFYLVLFNMNRCIDIILYQTLGKQNSILVVITFPGHESDQWVLTKCQLTIGG